MGDALEHLLHQRSGPLRGLGDYRRFTGRLAKIVMREKVDGQGFFRGKIAGVEGQPDGGPAADAAERVRSGVLAVAFDDEGERALAARGEWQRGGRWCYCFQADIGPRFQASRPAPRSSRSRLAGV